MAVMDEFREKREKIRTASAKEKWKYFTDYYPLGIHLEILMI